MTLEHCQEHLWNSCDSNRCENTFWPKSKIAEIFRQPSFLILQAGNQNILQTRSPTWIFAMRCNSIDAEECCSETQLNAPVSPALFSR